MADNRLNDQELDNVAGGMQNINNAGSTAGGDQKFDDNSNNAGGNVLDNTAGGDIVFGSKTDTKVDTKVETDVDVDTW